MYNKKSYFSRLLGISLSVASVISCNNKSDKKENISNNLLTGPEDIGNAPFADGNNTLGIPKGSIKNNSERKDILVEEQSKIDSPSPTEKETVDNLDRLKQQDHSSIGDDTAGGVYDREVNCNEQSVSDSIDEDVDDLTDGSVDDSGNEAGLGDPNDRGVSGVLDNNLGNSQIIARALKNPQLTVLLNDQELLDATQSTGIVEVLQNQKIAKTLKDSKIVLIIIEVFEKPEFPRLIECIQKYPQSTEAQNNPQLTALLRDEEFVDAMQSTGMLEILKNQKIREALKDPQIVNLLTDNELMQILKNPDIIKALKDPQYREILIQKISTDSPISESELINSIWKTINLRTSVLRTSKILLFNKKEEDRIGRKTREERDEKKKWVLQKESRDLLKILKVNITKLIEIVSVEEKEKAKLDKFDKTLKLLLPEGDESTPNGKEFESKEVSTIKADFRECTKSFKETFQGSFFLLKKTKQ